MEIRTITSRTNPLIIETAKLQDKKYRRQSGLFFFEGRKLFLDACQAGIPLENIFVTEDYLEKYRSELTHHVIITLPPAVFEKISTEKSPQGIICTAKHLDFLHKSVTIYNTEDFDANAGRLLISGMQDPGNLGTVIRAACALGADELILDSACADLYNPKTVRAAMGALFRQKITICPDMADMTMQLRQLGCQVYAAALGRDSLRLDRLPMKKNVCFIIGNEGHGLSDEVVAAADGSVIIPMRPGSESLNAASAASILLWHRCAAVGTEF